MEENDTERDGIQYIQYSRLEVKYTGHLKWVNFLVFPNFILGIISIPTVSIHLSCMKIYDAPVSTYYSI